MNIRAPTNTTNGGSRLAKDFGTIDMSLDLLRDNASPFEYVLLYRGKEQNYFLGEDSIV